MQKKIEEEKTKIINNLQININLYMLAYRSNNRR